MNRTAVLKTDKAERLMKALCNHFARKVTARYEGSRGWVDFNDAKCEFTAGEDALILRAEADTVEGLAHVERAVGGHLGRFLPGEKVQLTWQDA